MSKKEIIEAWAWVRENNHSISDDVLDFMKDSAIYTLQNKVSYERDKEVEKLKNLLNASNEILRSCYSIIERKGESTNWSSIERAVRKVLVDQHKELFDSKNNE